MHKVAAPSFGASPRRCHDHCAARAALARYCPRPHLRLSAAARPEKWISPSSPSRPFLTSNKYPTALFIVQGVVIEDIAIAPDFALAAAATAQPRRVRAHGEVQRHRERIGTQRLAGRIAVDVRRGKPLGPMRSAEHRPLWSTSSPTITRWTRRRRRSSSSGAAEAAMGQRPASGTRQSIQEVGKEETEEKKVKQSLQFVHKNPNQEKQSNRLPTRHRIRMLLCSRTGEEEGPIVSSPVRRSSTASTSSASTST